MSAEIVIPEADVIVGELRDGQMLCQLVVRPGSVRLKFASGIRTAEVMFTADAAHKMAALMLAAARAAERRRRAAEL